jgi:hypothetical protein
VVCEQPLLAYADAAMPMQTPAHREYIRQRLNPTPPGESMNGMEDLLARWEAAKK